MYGCVIVGVQGSEPCFDWNAAATIAFAKFGARLANQNVERLLRHIEVGTDTRLYLVFKSRSKFEGHSASIKAIRVQTGPGDWESLVPRYYKELYLVPSMWLLLGQEFQPTELAGIRLLSNARLLTDVVAECRTSMMLVTNL